MGSNQMEMVLNTHRDSSKRGCCPFFSCVSPSHRRLFELIHLLNLIYIAVIVPLDIAFISALDTGFLVMEIVSIVLAWGVIWINLRTPVLVNGAFTLRIGPVLREYLGRGLIYDVFAALPLNLVLSYYHCDYPMMILVAICRATRMLGIRRLLDLFEKFEIYLKNLNVLLFTFKAALLMYLLWHWTSCVWYFINRVEHNLYEITWVKTFNVHLKTVGEEYLLSLYYVIKIVTGVG